MRNVQHQDVTRECWQAEGAEVRVHGSTHRLEFDRLDGQMLVDEAKKRDSGVVVLPRIEAQET